MTGRKPYRSDLSDAEWALVEPELTAWRAPRLARKVSSGSQPVHALREIVNAILYVNRTGCAWEYLPHDLPPFKTVYGYFAAWRDEGVAERIHDLLSVLGVSAASLADSPVGRQVLDHVAYKAPTVTKAWVDGGYNQEVVDHGAELGIDIEAAAREPGIGFKVLPHRWAVERTFGWFMLHRRLVRDNETRQESSRTMIHWSTIGVMGRALTRTSTPTWQDTTGKAV